MRKPRLPALLCLVLFAAPAVPALEIAAQPDTPAALAAELEQVRVEKQRLQDGVEDVRRRLDERRRTAESLLQRERELQMHSNQAPSVGSSEVKRILEKPLCRKACSAHQTVIDNEHCLSGCHLEAVIDYSRMPVGAAESAAGSSAVAAASKALERTLCSNLCNLKVPGAERDQCTAHCRLHLVVAPETAAGVPPAPVPLQQLSTMMPVQAVQMPPFSAMPAPQPQDVYQQLLVPGQQAPQMFQQPLQQQAAYRLQPVFQQQAAFQPLQQQLPQQPLPQHPVQQLMQQALAPVQRAATPKTGVTALVQMPLAKKASASGAAAFNTVERKTFAENMCGVFCRHIAAGAAQAQCFDKCHSTLDGGSAPRPMALIAKKEEPSKASIPPGSLQPNVCGMFCEKIEVGARRDMCLQKCKDELPDKQAKAQPEKSPDAPLQQVLTSLTEYHPSDFKSKMCDAFCTKMEEGARQQLCIEKCALALHDYSQGAARPLAEPAVALVAPAPVAPVLPVMVPVAPAVAPPAAAAPVAPPAAAAPAVPAAPAAPTAAAAAVPQAVLADAAASVNATVAASAEACNPDLASHAFGGLKPGESILIQAAIQWGNRACIPQRDVEATFQALDCAPTDGIVTYAEFAGRSLIASVLLQKDSEDIAAAAKRKRKQQKRLRKAKVTKPAA